MKLVIDPAPDTLSTEDLNTHFSALGECSISRSVNFTQPPRVTVAYSDFTTALQKLLTLHFSPLLRTSRLDFKLDCSIDVSVKAHADEPRSRSRSPRRCEETAEEDKAEEAKPDGASSPGHKPQEPPKEESKEEEVKEKKEEAKEKKEEAKVDRKEEPRKKKRDKNAPKKNIHVESDGSHFQILRKYKNDENTQLHCLSCKRKVLKRSVGSHVATNTHKRNFSRQRKDEQTHNISQDAGKTLTANDLPQRHKSILHLVTEPNFLTNDLDFSQSRPFTAKPRLRPSRTSISTVMHHLARDQVPLTWDQSPARKRAFPQSSQNLSSSFDLGWTRPSQEAESPRKALSKQAEDMIQGKLLLRADLPPPQQRVSKAKQERVGLYMNSHLMQSAMRQRGVNASAKK